MRPPHKDQKFSRQKQGVRQQSAATMKQPQPLVQTTTMWDFPSQHYGAETQGDQEYTGVTPSYVIWNLLQRYTKPSETVLDPMCGSGTTLDVCKDLKREAVGFDISPSRPEIKKADARKLPLKDESIDFVFIDPPYSTHVKYSGDPKCIGELDARGGGYYEAMEEVIAELYRVLRDDKYLALYVSDSFAKGKPFCPIGFELFLRMSRLFEPVDIIAVTRYNKKLKRNHWHTSAIEGNYFLRGFNYLFVMKKVSSSESAQKHESAGSLSHYFRAAARANPGEVITPDRLGKAVQENQDKWDRKLVKKAHKSRERDQERPRPASGPKKKFRPRKDRP